jgi:UDP-N-acetyl-D-mannosaminuronate dehydrogenase
MLYSQIVNRVVQVSSTRVAEMTKLLENIHRAVNISLVNELKVVTDAMNIDIWEVIDAAATSLLVLCLIIKALGLVGIVSQLILFI